MHFEMFSDRRQLKRIKQKLPKSNPLWETAKTQQPRMVSAHIYEDGLKSSWLKSSWLKSSYDVIISAVVDFFLPMGSKHYNTD